LTTGTTTTLLERERELRELDEALAAALEGGGRLILIEAPAGLGKTSLLNVACEAAAAEGFVCLRARATELERDFAYGSVRQLLEPVVARATDGERERLFAGAAGLSQPLFAPTGASLDPGPDSSLAMLHGLYWLLNNLADEAPVAMAVDDLHWCDAESLRFLNYLAPRLDGLSVALIASARDEEDRGGDLVRLAAGPETRMVRPRPLSTGATAKICEGRLGPVAPEFATACREATGGNPFFLEALLREVEEQAVPRDSGGAVRVRQIGPAAVAQAVLLRLSGAPAAASALVRAAAVLGDGSMLNEVAALAELAPEEAARAVDLLVTLAILKPGADLEFAHPIVRESVYADIGPRERAEAHARAGAILRSLGASEERIAAQIVASEPAADPETVALLRRVASESLVRGAPSAAVAYLRRALAEPPPAELRGELLVELSSAELRLGTPEAAVGHLKEAGELITEPELLAKSVRLLGSAFTWSGNADRAVEAIGQAIERIEREDRELTLLLEADRAAYAQQGSLEARAPARDRLERYAELEGATQGERLVLASLAFERSRASESEHEAVAFIESALDGDRLLAEQELDVAGTLYLLALGLLATDALDLASECLDEMFADAHARASIPAQAFVFAHRGWASFYGGDLTHAEADGEMALELLTTYEIPLGTRFARALLIRTLIEGGDLDSAEALLRDADTGEEIPAGMASNALLESRGLLRLAQDRHRQAVEDLTQFGRNDELFGGANPLASRWRSHAALALAGAGDGEAARGMAADDLERARRWGAASGIGIALRATALVEPDGGSVDRLREAVETLERSPARLEHARALVDLGAALRRANRRADARGFLEEGLALAERCGSRALAGRAREELLAAGGRSSDPFGSGVEQLTASERRVAELAAAGHSNPEIAQALFVTRKTIETHLGRVYRKLDISGRGELAEALGERAPAAGT
jgi:DNA-binding CsgD family transcriptional regulator